MKPPFSWSAIANRRSLDARFAVQTAGCCCVRQWNAPRPQINSVQSIGTMRRFGKSFRERRFGDRIVRIIERRQQDAFVRDVEIRVAGGQPQIFAINPRRHRQA